MAARRLSFFPRWMRRFHFWRDQRFANRVESNSGIDEAKSNVHDPKEDSVRCVAIVPQLCAYFNSCSCSREKNPPWKQTVEGRVRCDEENSAGFATGRNRK